MGTEDTDGEFEFSTSTADDNHTEEPSEKSQKVLGRVNERLDSRRSFMANAAKIGAAGLAFSAAGVGTAAAQEEISQADLDVLNYALLLERLEAAFYTEAMGTAPPGESGGGGNFTEQEVERSDVAKQFAKPNLRYSTYAYFQQIRDQEQTHRDTLIEVIEENGGDPVGDPGFTFPYETFEEFIGLAKIIEDTGAAAYTAVTPEIENLEYRTAATQIVVVEGRHASYLRVLTPEAHTPHPNTFQRTLSMDAVTEAVQPFIDS